MISRRNLLASTALIAAKPFDALGKTLPPSNFIQLTGTSVITFDTSWAAGVISFTQGGGKTLKLSGNWIWPKDSNPSIKPQGQLDLWTIDDLHLHRLLDPRTPNSEDTSQRAAVGRPVDRSGVDNQPRPEDGSPFSNQDTAT